MLVLFSNQTIPVEISPLRDEKRERAAASGCSRRFNVFCDFNVFIFPCELNEFFMWRFSMRNVPGFLRRTIRTGLITVSSLFGVSCAVLLLARNNKLSLFEKDESLIV